MKMRYWAQENPHWYAERKEHRAAPVLVWLGVFKQNLVGPFFGDQLLVNSYLNMLANEMIPQQTLSPFAWGLRGVKSALFGTLT